MEMPKLIQQFKRYSVWLDSFNRCYFILNDITRVVEDTGTRLPTILFQAEASDTALEQFYKSYPTEGSSGEVVTRHGCSAVSGGVNNDGSSLPRGGEDSCSS